MKTTLTLVFALLLLVAVGIEQDYRAQQNTLISLGEVAKLSTVSF